MELEEKIACFELDEDTIFLPTVENMREFIKTLLIQDGNGHAIKDGNWKNAFSIAVSRREGIPLVLYEHPLWSEGTLFQLWIELDDKDEPVFQMNASRAKVGSVESEYSKKGSTVKDLMDGLVDGEQVLADFIDFIKSTCTKEPFSELLHPDELREFTGCYW